MSKIKYFIQQSWLLIASSLFFGLILAIADAAWTPKIEANKINKLNKLMAALLPDAGQFQFVEQIQIESSPQQTQEINLYKAVSIAGQNAGWAFEASGFGFADKIELVVAVDKDFKKIAGYAVLSSNETPGFGDQIKLPWYRNQFAGVPAEQLQLERSGNPDKKDNQIVAITGATISSRAVVSIINNTLLPLKAQMQQKGLLSGGN
jgi:electron transport complex protein RnfG